MNYYHYNEADEEIIWDIDYHATAGIAERITDDHSTCHPAESAQIEITAVIDPAGNDILSTLNESTIEAIKEACEEQMISLEEY